MTDLKKATRKFISICRDNGSPEVHQAAIDYAKAVELHISGMELEHDSQAYTIAKQQKEINLQVDIMKSYGIDVNKLANRSIYTILGDIDLSMKYGTFRAPENLINHLKI